MDIGTVVLFLLFGAAFLVALIFVVRLGVRLGLKDVIKDIEQQGK